MSRRARLVVALALLALTMACGQDGSGKVPAQQWAKDVCMSVRPWASKIQTAVSSTQATLAKSSEPKVVKPQLTQLFSGAARDTDTAVAQIDAAGVPDVENGERIAKDFRAALVSARNAFASAQTSVQALDTSDKARFDAAVSQVGTKLKQDYAKAGANIKKATSAELTKAFESEPACQ